jgi:hypothetical protein
MNLFYQLQGMFNTADFAFVGRLDEPDDSEVDLIEEIQLMADAVDRAIKLQPQLIYDPAFQVLFEDDWKKVEGWKKVK